jgi:hypothetical protein
MLLLQRRSWLPSTTQQLRPVGAGRAVATAAEQYEHPCQKQTSRVIDGDLAGCSVSSGKAMRTAKLSPYSLTPALPRPAGAAVAKLAPSSSACSGSRKASAGRTQAALRFAARLVACKLKTELT